MDRQFFPFGFGPFFGGFGFPFFFPGRRFFPFFTLSPFFFPFFRGEDDREGTYYAQHHCQEGDTYSRLAEMYNVPSPILEAMNPHIGQMGALSPGTVVYIPRLDKMNCQKMYLEQEAGPEAVSPMHAAQYPMGAYPMSNVGPTAAYPMSNVAPTAAYPMAAYPMTDVSPTAAYPMTNVGPTAFYPMTGVSPTAAYPASKEEPTAVFPMAGMGPTGLYPMAGIAPTAIYPASKAEPTAAYPLQTGPNAPYPYGLEHL